MKTLAFTRFRDKPELLGTWLKYYSQFFDELVVFGHQAAGCPTDLAEQYKFRWEDTQIELHSTNSLEFLSAKQVEFLETYDWVMYTDMDEIVVPDLRKFKDLKDYMRRTRKKQPFCEGFELYRIEEEGEGPIDRSKPILKQRKHWWKATSGSYSKNALSKIPSHWVHGFHSLREMNPEDAKKIHDTGLYMIHLKHVDDRFDLINHNTEGGVASDMPEWIRGAF